MRKTRRCTKVFCLLLELCTRFFHQTVCADQTANAVSAKFRKTRRYTKVVCGVLMIHSHTRLDPAIMQKCLENEMSMLQLPQDEVLSKSCLSRAELVH